MLDKCIEELGLANIIRDEKELLLKDFLECFSEP